MFVLLFFARLSLVYIRSLIGCDVFPALFDCQSGVVHLNPTHHFLYHDDLGPHAFDDVEELQQAEVGEDERHAVEGTHPPEIPTGWWQQEAESDGDQEGQVQDDVKLVPQASDPVP